MNKKMIAAGALLLLLGLPAIADTVYVRERMSTTIRADQSPDSAIVGKVQTGSGLDVLEQGDSSVKVRTADGIEGWIAKAYITSDKPAAMRILAAETRLKAVQAENDRLTQQVKSLEEKLKAAAASAAPAPAPAPEAVQKQAEASPPAASASFTGIPEILWFVISFAMLITGFVVGVWWLRERTRRKLGGMHIRVN